MNSEQINHLTPFGSNCSCMEMLQSVVDNQATEEQLLYFKQHLEGCAPCSANYRLDTMVKTLVQSRCCAGRPPEDLIDKIKEKINKL